jgi:hypothetical protein
VPPRASPCISFDLDAGVSNITLVASDQVGGCNAMTALLIDSAAALFDTTIFMHYHNRDASTFTGPPNNPPRNLERHSRPSNHVPESQPQQAQSTPTLRAQT